MKQKKRVIDFNCKETPGSLYELRRKKIEVLWKDNSLGFHDIKHNYNMSYINIGQLVLYLGSTEVDKANFLLPNGTVGSISTYMLNRMSFYGLALVKVEGGNNAQI
jgi:hypothetical protein